MSETSVLLSVSHRIATVTINQPEIGNALTVSAFQKAKDAIDQCADAPDVRVVVITGAGKNFSAGGYIPEFCKMLETHGALSDELLNGAEALSMSVRKCPKPVIAKINGSAAGAGCGLALAADFRIMTPKSKLVTAFANLAVPGDSFTQYYLSKLVGVSRAAKYIMAGVPITAAEALTTGIAHAVVEETEFDAATMQLAEQLAAGPGEVYAFQKEYFMKTVFSDMQMVAGLELHGMKQCSQSRNFSEALQAFLEKRKPAYQ